MLNCHQLSHLKKIANNWIQHSSLCYAIWSTCYQTINITSKIDMENLHGARWFTAKFWSNCRVTFVIHIFTGTPRFSHPFKFQPKFVPSFNFHTPSFLTFFTPRLAISLPLCALCNSKNAASTFSLLLLAIYLSSSPTAYH